MPEVAVVDVFWKVLAECLDEGFVILRCVKFFCAEKRFVPEFPSALQHFHVKKCLKLGGDILEEREHCALGMLVA